MQRRSTLVFVFLITICELAFSFTLADYNLKTLSTLIEIAANRSKTDISQSLKIRLKFDLESSKNMIYSVEHQKLITIAALYFSFDGKNSNDEMIKSYVKLVYGKKRLKVFEKAEREILAELVKSIPDFQYFRILKKYVKLTELDIPDDQQYRNRNLLCTFYSTLRLKNSYLECHQIAKSKLKKLNLVDESEKLSASLVNFYILINDSKSARENLTLYSKNFPQKVLESSLFNLRIALIENRLNEAADVAKQILAQKGNPKHVVYRAGLNLTLLEIHNKNFTAAKSLIEMTRLHFSDNKEAPPFHLVFLAMINYKMGNSANAQKDLDEAIKKFEMLSPTTSLYPMLILYCLKKKYSGPTADNMFSVYFKNAQKDLDSLEEKISYAEVLIDAYNYILNNQNQDLKKSAEIVQKLKVHYNDAELIFDFI